jgi:hypothetical protein
MKLDAICYGFLFAAAAGLHEPNVQKAMADIGLVGASWFVFLSACLLLGHSAAWRDAQDKRPKIPQKYPTYGLALK